MAATVLAVLGCIVVSAYLLENYGVLHPNSFLYDSNKPLSFVCGISFFLFFKNLKIRNSRFINTVAASSFGVLLIHANGDYMRQWLWKDVLNCTAMYDSNLLIIHAVASVLGIYVICTFIDWLRKKFVERPILILWDKSEEKICAAYTRLENSLCEKLHIK